MQFKEIKTLKTLLQPVENGWQVMHKKYKTPYGIIQCEISGETVSVVTEFGAYADERLEARDAVLRSLFED